jgi:hypothetical protein
MKKLALAFLLLQPAFLLAAPVKPNPADFTLTVHVVYSSTTLGGGVQLLDVLIDGQQMKLGCGTATGVLTLGDYPARVSPNVGKVGKAKDPYPYDIVKGYDLLMPDGKERTYTVMAMGTALIPAVPSNP